MLWWICIQFLWWHSQLHGPPWFSVDITLNHPNKNFICSSGPTIPQGALHPLRKRGTRIDAVPLVRLTCGKVYEKQKLPVGPVEVVDVVNPNPKAVSNRDGLYIYINHVNPPTLEVHRVYRIISGNFLGVWQVPYWLIPIEVCCVPCPVPTLLMRASENGDTPSSLIFRGNTGWIKHGMVIVKKKTPLLIMSMLVRGWQQSEGCGLTRSDK